MDPTSLFSMYVDFKDVPRRKACGKVFLENSFEIASNRKYDRYQRGLAPMVYIVFDRS